MNRNLKFKLLSFIVASVLTDSAVLAQQKLSAINVVKAFPFQQTEVVLEPSWVKQREDVNTAYLLSLNPDGLLYNFRVNAKLPAPGKPLGGWEAPGIGLRGHFTGHYLSAISVLVNKSQNPLLKQRLNYMVDELYKCQQAMGGGYLSAFPEKDFDTLEKTYGNVWAPYYTLHKIMQGLLDAYTYTGKKKAYQIVNNMAGYVGQRMSKLSPESIDKMLYTPDANPSNEAGAMNDVLYKLYLSSHNPQHLALAKLFDRGWFFSPLSKNQDILSGLHSNTHLVLVNGFAQGYAITGDTLYRNAATNFWDMLLNHHAYVNGSSSGPRPNVVTPTSLTSEHWGVPNQLSNTMTKEIAESCVTHNTQKLTSALFGWYPDAKYADTYMNTFYNATLALQNAKNGAVVYHLPLGSPQTKHFLKDDDFRCCNGTSVEAFAALNSGIYYHNDSTLWVNLYVPSKLNWKEKSLSLVQSGNFPTDSIVNFTFVQVKSSPLTLKFLNPSWSNRVEVYVNTQKQNIDTRPESFLSIRRKWKEGDQVKLTFHYDFHIKAMPDDKNVIALFYGPTLLAAQTKSEFILKGSYNDILKGLRASGPGQFSLQNNNRTFALKPLYDINEQTYGVYATIRAY